MPRLKAAFKGSIPTVDSAGLMPTLDQVRHLLMNCQGMEMTVAIIM